MQCEVFNNQIYVMTSVKWYNYIDLKTVGYFNLLRFDMTDVLARTEDSEVPLEERVEFSKDGRLKLREPSYMLRRWTLYSGEDLMWKKPRKYRQRARKHCGGMPARVNYRSFRKRKYNH